MRAARVVVAGLAVAGLLAGTLAGSAEAQADSALAPLYGPDVTTASGAARVVPGGYIVVLKDDAADVAQAASARAQGLGASITRTYTHGLHGYSAQLSADELAAVRTDPSVAYVERDQVIHTDRSSISAPRARPSVSATQASTQRDVDSWGLDRMDQRKLPLDGAYYSQDDADAGTVYVVNDGVYTGYTSLLEDQGVDLVGGSTTGEGCQQLGTYIANIVGGASYGVAKRAPVSSVRVVDCDGRTTTSLLISGLEWVLLYDNLRTGVVDLGIQIPADQALDDAVTNLIDAGIPVVSGAFLEDGFDACTTSPTRLPGVVTVSGTTIKDQASSRSATGPCVDIWAPAQSVISVVPPPPGEGGEWIATGSSPDFAAAYVTGAIIQYKRWEQRYQPGQKATPAQIMAALTQMSSKNQVSGVPAGTTANLAFSKLYVPLPASTTGTDRLRAGQSMVRDGKSRLTSKSGTYYLQYRASDGHLCVYTSATNRAHWCFGHATAWVNMNTAGTLGQYDGYGQKIETSGVKGGASTMVVNDKGYIYVKRNSDGVATWSSPH